MHSDFENRISEVQRKINFLQDKLSSHYINLSITNFRSSLAPLSTHLDMYSRLSGHTEKVFGLSWGGAGSSRNPEALHLLASVASDGEVVVWNTNKLKPAYKATIRTDDPWLMHCTFEKSEGTLLAAAGMHGNVYVYQLSLSKNKKLTLKDNPVVTFFAHDSYVPCCEFVSKVDFLTVSGDSTCKLWNLEVSHSPVRVLQAHEDDIMALSLCPLNPQVFLTGGCDKTVRLWDLRQRDSNLSTIYHHEGHVNALKFFANSNYTFATASSDCSARVFDLRALKPLSQYKKNSPLSCLEVSLSGRLIFTGDESGKVSIWDTFDERVPIQVLSNHRSQITRMELNRLGSMLATCSFDKSVILWKTFHVSVV